MAAVAFAFAACGNSNSNNGAAVETKAQEHVCNHNHGEGHECGHNHEGEHKCNHETGECNQPAEKQCDACKEAAAKKAAAEQAQ